MKAGKHWLASPSGILKNAQHKSSTVINLLPVGMDASNIWGLRTTSFQDIAEIFIAQGP